ncbi:MAG: hypothetical protein HQ479_12335 [Rhodobacter sp.]|jgi:hypothetical protein|nr:hypothetical protein [Rhodobacter sp.]
MTCKSVDISDAWPDRPSGVGFRIEPVVIRPPDINRTIAGALTSPDAFGLTLKPSRRHTGAKIRNRPTARVTKPEPRKDMSCTGCQQSKS